LNGGSEKPTIFLGVVSGSSNEMAQDLGKGAGVGKTMMAFTPDFVLV